MTNEEIKAEKERMYVIIKSANERLDEIRKICRHEKTLIGLYQVRIGMNLKSEICEYCGEYLRDCELSINKPITTVFSKSIPLKKLKNLKNP